MARWDPDERKQVRVNAVIQARLGSSRLPGKVLRTLGDRPVLDWVVDAAIRADGIDEVVVATSTATADDAVADRATALGVTVVRASEDDVLSRFVAAVDAAPCDAVVRLTADCPLLDPELISLVAATIKNTPWADYISTTLVRTLPRGLDTEVVRSSVLRALDRSATGHDRVHVTSAVYADPSTYRCLGLSFAPRADDLRVTLDTPEDAALLDKLVEELDGPQGWRTVVEVLRSRPDLVALNATVVQKPLEAG